MATIDDLDIQSLLEMTKEECIELLRQLRLSRRKMKKSTKSTTSVKNQQKMKKQPNIDPAALTPEQAAAILALIGE